MQYPEVKAKNPIEYDPHPIYLHSDREKCPKCKGKFLFCITTGEVREAFCKAYKCPVCGDWKKYELQKAIDKFIKNWQSVTLWTFTFSSHIFDGLNMEERFRLSSKCWKSFRDLLRKDKRLKGTQKYFNYIKFVELQKNGSPHYHAIIDRFVWQQTINQIWQTAISYNTDYKGTLGNANFAPKDKQVTKERASKYIIKYITKQIEDIPDGVVYRRWSKSGEGLMFAKKEKCGDWLFIVLNSERNSITSAIEFALFNKKEAEEQTNVLFHIEKPPPREVIEESYYGID